MRKKILFTVFIMSLFTMQVKAQSVATMSGTSANAGLLIAMTLSETNPLNFGSSMLATSAGGTVLLPSNSTDRQYTGGVANSTATPIATVASYNVNGTGLETYAIVLPSTIIVSHTTVPTGINTMNISLMTARFNGADSDATTSTLAADGTDSFTLGATLTVQEDQVGGTYAGTFQVSVDYN